MATRSVAPYERSVFINCPFDDDYKPLLDALLFGIHDCGFSARIAVEDVGSANRLNKLFGYIDECQYSIHDLSRIQKPRLNMAFECGLVFGAMHFGTAKHQDKDLLILDEKDHQYKKTMSDISGQDGKTHQNNPEEVIRCVRTFLARKAQGSPMRGHTEINKRYMKFTGELPTLAQGAQLTLPELATLEYLPELMLLMVKWIAKNP